VTLSINDTQHMRHSADITAIILCVIMPSVLFFYWYAKCLYAECRHAESPYAECRYAVCCGVIHSALILCLLQSGPISYSVCYWQDFPA
jgi:hypothetical protein